MKNSQSSDSKAREKSNKNEKKIQVEKHFSNMELMIGKLQDDASSLSYEESLKALDLILEDLQNDNVPVEDLQRHYIRGNIYLNHCEKLLNNIEQEIIELKPEDLV